MNEKKKKYLVLLDLPEDFELCASEDCEDANNMCPFTDTDFIYGDGFCKYGYDECPFRNDVTENLKKCKEYVDNVLKCLEDIIKYSQG